MATFATRGLILIFSLTIVFHLLVLTGIIPYDIVWGGRIQTQADMYRFESLSLVVNAFFLLIVLINARLLPIQLPARLVGFVLWFMAFLFLLNTVGNLLSTNDTEKLIFTPLTAIIFGLTVVLLRHRNQPKRPTAD
ncbi:hypothetical protein GCM10027275_40510 [Rhabdobacter roseus]|uniref:Uncharacterized protein n=1 Tax=Rhabdobacter roseus TaxID=1655419 RepID=A0A840TRT9_9BACT|nr:hypothetical protein [Rhabdobacter roseus]MBB5286024.1 hypothetical protein [Rhabdobacter roseus]